jgi:hypothetical protein
VSLGLLVATLLFLVYPLAKLVWRAMHRKPAAPAVQGEGR